MINRILVDYDFVNIYMNDDFELILEYLTHFQYLRNYFMNYDDIIDEVIYKEKIFEDFSDNYHTLKINVKINDNDILLEKIKDHILEHYHLI